MGYFYAFFAVIIFLSGCGESDYSDIQKPVDESIDQDKSIVSKPIETSENIEKSEKKELESLYRQYIKSAQDELGDVYTVPGIEMEMLWVHPGTFTAGSPKTEIGRGGNENQREKKINFGFYLGKFEVSQVQWESVMGNNPSKFKGPNLPVENISWQDAVEFCEKLTKVEIFNARLPNGFAYQLPTQMEWEYACRAGTKSAYWWGGSPDSKNANYDSDISDGTTKEINSYLPNPWGFFNVHGNVWEYCSDTSEFSPVFRFARGGSWSDNSDFLRSAYRLEIQKDSYNHTLGLRIALKVSM